MTVDWKLALHTWTIDTTGLAVALDAAKASGYDAVELRRSDFVQCFERGQSRGEVIETIRASGIKTGILGTEYGWFFAEGQEQLRLFQVLRETCEIARALDCDLIMSAPGQLTGTLRQAADATRIAGEIVGEFGLRLALEFNSQHPVVNRTEALREIIAQAGHAHCGMLLDAYHLYRSQGIAAGLAGVKAEELFVFQYSDVPRIPASGVRRPVDRLPPGDGVVDWRELFALLQQIGYQGYLSYEAPNPAQWHRSPYHVAREGLENTKALISGLSQQSQPKSNTSLKDTTMADVTLSQSTTIIDAALKAGREKGLDPLTVVVLDRGGHVVAVKREDDSGIMRYEIACGKAYGALGFGFGSRGLATRAAKAPHFINAVAASGTMIPAPGGVLIRNGEGRVIGAVGISGDTGDNDEACAMTGIETALLSADQGA